MYTLNADREVVVGEFSDCFNELDEINRRYQQDCSRVNNTISSLHRRYNALAPVSRLPHELLSHIFEDFLANHWAPYSQDTKRRLDHEAYKCSMRGRLVPLHTCQHWRNVALGNPVLWTHIELRCKSFVRFALAHAMNLPLTIYVDQDFLWYQQLQQPYSESLYQLIIPRFSRIRSLQLHITVPVREVFEQAYRHNPEQQAPILESLTLIMDIESDDIPFLSGMVFPRLSTLTLSRASSLLLMALHRPTLTVLSVSFSRGGKPSEVAAALRQLPRLQRLELSKFQNDNIPPLSQGGLPSWCRPIMLPHLAHLSIKGHVWAVHFLLLWMCLEFPESTQIAFTIDAYPWVQFPKVHEGVLSIVLQKAFGALQVVPLRGVEVLHAPHPSLSAVLWSALRPPNLTQAEKTKATEGRRLQLTVAAHAREEALACLFGMLDLSEFHAMEIEEELPAEAWRRIFTHRALPKLHELTLCRSPAVTQVLSAMATPLPSSQRDNQHFLFPALKMLTLSCCQFRTHPQRISPGDALPEILRTLRSRSEQGCKLDVLYIERPVNLTREEDLAQFEDHLIASCVQVELKEVTRNQRPRRT
ncbi:hypothetical protein EIP86_006017 [Pleurotus ostreatoroseus]|nr:hypothetical protein EIP86_006017 [Pleurotus ostreatoroseus]